MLQRNDGTGGQDDVWLRAQIAEILAGGWTLEELETIGISRAMLIRLGFRDDHPRLFEDPVPRRRRPSREPRPDPGAPRPLHGTEAASPVHRDAASAFWRVRCAGATSTGG
ncbi:MAG TPA: hypothetical protein VF584_19405 [Longimicrobium sp.]|jgi:hypothetical protein